MNDNNQSKKSPKRIAQANPLEAIKDIGSKTTESLKEDLVKKVPQDFMNQLFGQRPRSYSGEIMAGESLEIKEVFTGEHEKNQRLRKQLILERGLRIQDKEQRDKKTGVLRMQLKVLQEEILVVVEKTKDLSDETKIAAMQAPIEPGVYYVIFFEKLLEFIKSFRKKIEESSVWLHATNKRAAKKNVWGANYKKQGAKYLLSSEHYLTRSAG
ncbi:hypothetical protein IID22_04095 [Patescibacteria group bacterium]|nr:hypothetical protein [Patescibacteria group bacterium]